MCHLPAPLPAPTLKVVVLNTVTDIGFANRGADDLGVEAVYSRDRAIGHKQTLAPGYYVDLRRTIAQLVAALAWSIRTVSNTQKCCHVAKVCTNAWPSLIIVLSATTLYRALARADVQTTVIRTL